jgi:hypothetical protein
MFLYANPIGLPIQITLATAKCLQESSKRQASSLEELFRCVKLFLNAIQHNQVELIEQNISNFTNEHRRSCELALPSSWADEYF